MLRLEYLQELLISAIALSTITCSFIQKIKACFKTSKYLSHFSFIINMLLGIIFSYTFTDISLPNSLWVGFFSFIGADTIYKALEGKLASHSDIISKNSVTILKSDIINSEEES